jgi:hypothetical protein
MPAEPPLLTPDVIRRGLLVCLGIAIVSLGFIASYAGALHAPTPHEVPVAVTKAVPAQVSQQLSGSPAVKVVAVADDRAAARAIDRRKAYGSVTVTSSGFVVTTAPAASSAMATLLQSELVPQLRKTGQPVRAASVHDLPAGDSRGVTVFYVVAGWVIAGYLGATLLGMAFGSQPRGRAGLGLRLGTLALLGLVIGLGGVLIAKGVADVPGPWLALALLGSLTIAAAGAVTIALQTLFGLVGTGLAILLFVVLGNPSSGGPAATELLASPWREFGQAIPVGAGVSVFRDLAYFPDAPIAGPLLILVAWLLIGAAVAFAFVNRAKPMTQADAELAAVAA